MRNFILSCESTVDLPYSYLEKRELPVLFYTYSVDGKEYTDDLGKDPRSLPNFYHLLAGGAIPSTSQINRFRYKEFFEELLKQGDVIHVTLSSGITGSYANAAAAAEEAVEELAEDAVQTQKEPKENKDAPAKQQRQPKERKPRAPKPKTEKPREAMAPAEVFQPTEPPVLYPEDTPAGCAQRFLMNLTEKMGVKVDVYVDQNQENALGLRLIGDTLGILIGRRGETLDAIQYLTSLQVNRGNEDYIRVVLDTENYRAKREDSLRRLAMRMANRAQKTGRRVVMEPMNPYERRVMHTALQDHPAVTTHSEGEEPNRRVVITLKATENTSVDAAGEEGTEAVQKPKRKRSHRRSRKPKTARTETVSSENTAIEESATPASIEE